MFKWLMFKENREDYPHNLIKFRVKDLSGVDPEPGPTIAKKFRFWIPKSIKTGYRIRLCLDFYLINPLFSFDMTVNIIQKYASL